MVELGPHDGCKGWQGLNDITIRVFLPTRSMLLRLVLFPSAHFTYFLQLEGNTWDDFAGLGKIDADEEVQSGPFPAELLVECYELWTSDFIEVHELLSVEAYL